MSAVHVAIYADKDPGGKKLIVTLQRRDAGAPKRHPHAAAVADAGFDQRQQLIDAERQSRRGEATEQHEHPVLGLQACKDIIAKAGLPDRRG